MQHGCRRMTIIGLDGADCDQRHAPRDKVRDAVWSWKLHGFLRGVNPDNLSAQKMTARQFCARDIKYYYNKTTNLIGELQTTRRSSSCVAKDFERRINI
jgi:hypothetical protein